MQTSTPQITEYLDRFRQGDSDAAFFGLLEMEHEILPELMAAYRNEPTPRVRAFLVEVIWQHRQPLAIPFLGEALHDVESVVWKEAFNGLITLASPAALDVLRLARARHLTRQRDTDEFRSWLEEAIEQAEIEAQRV